MSEYNKIATGTVTVATGGVGQFVNLPFLPVSFKMWNKTKWGTSTSAQIQTAVGYADDPSGVAYLTSTAGSSSSALSSSKLASAGGGFSFVKAGTPVYGAPLALASTFVTQATAALVTTASAHGLSVGDVILLYGTTAMLQIAGIEYTVQTVPSPTTFTIDVNSSGFASAATAGFIKKQLHPDLYLPGARYITNIVADGTGLQAVVTTSVNHHMVVGQEVSFVIPPQWGMTQLDQFALTAIDPQIKIYATAVTANTITVNINISAFTPFAYPTSATAALGMTFPQIIPIGDQNSGGSAPGGVLTSLTIPGAFQTNTRQGVFVGPNILVNTSDVWEFEAIYPDLIVLD